jgi:hypothetical protein
MAKMILVNCSRAKCHSRLTPVRAGAAVLAQQPLCIQLLQDECITQVRQDLCRSGVTMGVLGVHCGAVDHKAPCLCDALQCMWLALGKAAMGRHRGLWK